MHKLILFLWLIFASSYGMAAELPREILFGSWIPPEKQFYGYGNMRIDRATVLWGGAGCKAVPYSIVENYSESMFVRASREWKVITLRLDSDDDDPCWGRDSERYFQFAFLIQRGHYVDGSYSQMELYTSKDSRKAGYYSSGIQFVRVGKTKVWDVSPKDSEPKE